MRRSPTKRFLFSLALRMGYINPYRMARRIPSWLLLEWEAYAAVEPFSEERADYRAAQIVQMLYNINRDTKKEPKGRPINDFVLQFDIPEKTDAEKKREEDEKLRIMTLVMRAQALAAAEQSVPKVIEEHYPQPSEQDIAPVTDDNAIVEALAKARAAIKPTGGYSVH